MTTQPDQIRLARRTLIKAAAAGVAATAVGCSQRPWRNEPKVTPVEHVKLCKAVKYPMVQEGQTVQDRFQLLKDLGFDGVEMMSPDDKIDRDEVLRARDATGLPIHGVVNTLHWKSPLSHPDPAERAACLDSLRTSIHDAKFYGATSVLLVPAVVNGGISYADAYDRSQAEIRKLIPLAEDTGIRILIENVWNNFLLSPLEAARYIDELDSPAIGAYFDVGNVVRYGWPEHWIRVLAHRIVKLDIKEYSRKKQQEEGLWKGFNVDIGDGDCRWDEVMKALREIGFSGWATAEVPGGDRARLQDIAARMDRVFAL